MHSIKQVILSAFVAFTAEPGAKPHLNLPQVGIDKITIRFPIYLECAKRFGNIGGDTFTLGAPGGSSLDNAAQKDAFFG